MRYVSLLGSPPAIMYLVTGNDQVYRSLAWIQADDWGTTRESREAKFTNVMPM